MSTRTTGREGPIDWAALRARLERAGEALAAGPSPATREAALAARALALAVPRTPSEDEGAVPAVDVAIGGERYALDAARVRAVLRHPPLTRVPGAPAFVVGLAQLRGEVVDVLDLRGFLGAAGPGPGADPALVVLGEDQVELALAVDRVDGLRPCDPRALAPAPPSPARTRPEYVRGLLPDGVALLDVDGILNDPRLVVDDSGRPAPGENATDPA